MTAPSPPADLFTPKEEPMQTAIQETAPANGALQVHEANPATMLQMAIDKGLGADQLKVFMDCYERFQDRQAEQAYTEAMQACQEEIIPVIKSKYNKQNQCYYADDEDVDAAIRPIYLKHGFSLSFGSGESHLPNHYRAVCDVRHAAGHKEHHWLDAPCDDRGLKGSPNKTPIQGVISTQTYLRRELKFNIFNVPRRDIDKDGQRPMAFITEEQAIQLQENIDGREVNIPKFMQWLGVERLGDLPASRFNEVLHAVRAKPLK